MSARTTEIKTVSYVHVGDKLVCTDDLDAERKKQLGTWIKTTYLNELFRGQARFYPAEAGSNT